MKRFCFYAVWLVVNLCITSFALYGEDAIASSTVYLPIKGHLSKEKLGELQRSVARIEKESTKWVVLDIQSQSGDIDATLDLAKSIFLLKEKHQVPVAAYIQDKAIGPAAILPFLAEELYISNIVAWGDISSSLENSPDRTLPINYLRSQITGLISEKSRHYNQLKFIAEAMIDPNLEIIDDYGLRIANAKEEMLNQNRLSPKGETLVINQNQLRKWDLISGILTVDEFQNKFNLQKTSVTSAEEIRSKERDKPFDQITYSQSGSNQIGYISITDRNGMISESTWIYVNAALSYYKENKPCFIILELNTPGGEVFAAQQISNALKEMDTQYGIPVVAYINNWAISAGAMLAYSCRYIVVVKDASMGAAEPVIMGAEGSPQSASEKINSALRTDFANCASFFNRNPYIAEAMVDKDVILVLRHNEIVKLDSEDQIRKGGMDPDIIISPKGKLLTLNSQQMMGFKVADFDLQPKRKESVTEEELSLGKWPFSKSDLYQIPELSRISFAEIDHFQMNWQTRLMAFLAHPAVSSILFLGMLIGFYIEMSTPGHGIAGSFAIVCLAFLVMSSLALEAMHWVEPFLLGIGLILLAIEIFILPSFGIVGIVGGILAIVGLMGMLIPGIRSISFDGSAFNVAGEYVLYRLGWFSASLIVSIGVMFGLSRLLSLRPTLMRHLVLTDTSLIKEELEEDVHSAVYKPIGNVPSVGSIGIVSITLRPSGAIRIGNTDYDAVSTGDFIDVGEKVKVIRIEGTKILVELA